MGFSQAVENDGVLAICAGNRGFKSVDVVVQFTPYPCQHDQAEFGRVLAVERAM